LEYQYNHNVSLYESSVLINSSLLKFNGVSVGSHEVNII